MGWDRCQATYSTPQRKRVRDESDGLISMIENIHTKDEHGTHLSATILTPCEDSAIRTHTQGVGFSTRYLKQGAHTRIIE